MASQVAAVDEAKVADCIRLVFKGDAGGLAALLKDCPEAASGHDASFNDSTPLHVAVGEGEAACAEALLAAGAPAGAVDCERRTPLHQVEHGCPEGLVAALVAAGAPVGACDARGWTPLHCACAAQACDAVTALLAAGADAAAVADDGLTAARLAARGDPDDADDLAGDAGDGYGDVFGVAGGAPLPRANHVILAALRAAGAASDAAAAAAWTTPDLDRHDFAVAPFGETAAWAPGAAVEITIAAAVEGSDADSASENEDIVEDVVKVELLERGGEGNGFWRCFLVETPPVVSDRVPQLGLLRGRELVVPLEPASWDRLDAALPEEDASDDRDGENDEPPTP